MPDSVPEQTIWQGRPSARMDLPFYAVLLVGAALGTLGLLFLLPAADLGPDATRNARLFSWVLGALWVAVVALALGRWLVRRSTHYVVTSQRLRITTGVLTTETEDVELRRVRDTTVQRTLYQRMTGLGDVRLTSADATAPRVTLRAVRDPLALQETLRQLVEDRIRLHGVREFDVM